MPWSSERTTVSGRLHNVGNLASIGTLFLGTLVRSNAVFVCLVKRSLYRLGVLGAHKEFKVVERFGADGVGYGRGDAALLHTHVDDVAHIGRQRQIGVAADYDKHDSCEQCRGYAFLKSLRILTRHLSFLIAVDNFVGTPKKAHHLLGICFAELLEESRGAGLEFPTFDFEITGIPCRSL